MARSKFTYYIVWKDENGAEQRKDYSAAGGRSYWKEKLIKQLGKDAIIEEGREAFVDDGNGNKVKHVTKEGVPEKLLGPVDEELSIFGLAPKGEGRRFVLSNWNTETRTYTSRVYGGLNGMYKIVEPDGYISLHGTNIIKSTDKETGVRTFVDGRKFTAMGWPLPDDTKMYGYEEEPVVEKKAKQPVKKKAPAKKATSAKPKAKKAPAKRKTTAKKK